MLVKLMPDQVARWWEVIQPAVEASLPPIAGSIKERRSKILSSLLSGRMHCWAVCTKDKSGKETIVKGIGTTTFVLDECSGAKSLLIYSAFANVKTEAEDWVDGFNTLTNFAKENKCDKIVAYTKNEKILHNAKQAGGDVWGYVIFPLDGNFEQKMFEGGENENIH